MLHVSCMLDYAIATTEILASSIVFDELWKCCCLQSLILYNVDSYALWPCSFVASHGNVTRANSYSSIERKKTKKQKTKKTNIVESDRK